jgi:hypothetical protein
LKLKNLITAACAALAGIAFFASAARATLPYNNGDLILGFRATGAPGAASNYEVNLGNIATYLNASGTVSPAVGNIKADLETLYGTGWISRSDVFWSASSFANPAMASPVIANNTMFATREQPAVGTQSTPWPPPSASSADAAVQKMVHMVSPATGYSAGTSEDLDQTESANSPVGLIQLTTGSNCYSSFQPGGTQTSGTTAFGYFAAPNGIEGTFADGTAGTVLDFYKVIPDSGASELLGTFTIDNNAVVTFMPVAVIPGSGALAFSAATFTAPEVNAQSAPSVVPVTFSRTDGTTGAVTADLTVTGGTLANGTDYVLADPTTVTFANGASTATVNIQLNSIAMGSLPGTIVLGLSNPTGGATLGTTISATVTINPVSANIHFTSATYSGSEAIAGGQIAIAITRDGNTSNAVSANFSTANGTAIAGTDYTAQTDTPVSFAAGQTTQTVQVAVVNVAGVQGSRAFNVSLSSPSAGAAVTAPTTGTVTITDDEVAAAGKIAFSAATVQANALNSANNPNTVALTLTRTSGTTGAVTVDVSVTGGTLINGTDYNTFANPTTVNFTSGAASATVNITLKAIPVTSVPGTIVLLLSNPTGGASLGTQTNTTVTVVCLLAYTRPRSHFEPRNPQGAPNTLPITLIRTIGVKGAVSVNVTTTGGSLVKNTDYTIPNPVVNFADGITSATVQIQLNAIAASRLPGTIILGLSGPTGNAAVGAQSVTLLTIRKRDLIRPRVIVTSLHAGSIVTAPFTLTGKALDANGIDHVEVVLNSGAVQLATLGTFASGKVSYSLAGLQPENGENTLAITAVDITGNRSAVLRLTLKYFNNRPEFAGGYNGLLVPAVTPTHNLSGRLKLTVTATGTFSGNVIVGGFNFPLVGFFDNDGKAHIKPGRGTSLTLVGKPERVALGNLELTVATDLVLGAKIIGTLKSDPATVTANVNAPRNFFNGLTTGTTVDTRYTLQNKGQFTVVFPAKAQGATPTSSFPQGDGYANLTLTATGAVTLIGKLADGTPFTTSANLAADYSWPFYLPLFGGKGSLGGLASFDDAQADSDLRGTNFLWFRPARPSSRYYPAGWPTGLQTDLLGAKYINPVAASVLPGLGPTDPANGNATLIFSDGKLTGPLSRNVNIDPANVVTNAPSTDKTFQLKIIKGSGQISGSFKHTDLTHPPFRGIILQKGVNAGAFGFFLSKVPPTPGATGESGGVSLESK